MRGRHIFALGAILLLMTACGGGGTEESADPGAEQWAAIQQLQPELNKLRADLAALTAAPAEAEGAEGEGGEGAEGETRTPEEIAAAAQEMRKTIADKTDELSNLVADYINSQGIVEGAELTANQKQAFSIKSDIDMVYAQEYIDQAGDYRKAIEIYEVALLSDPENQKLMDAKALAEKLRYMDEERFSAVKKGMTQEEVRGLLGTVRSTNVREFTDNNRVGWFYRKEDGGAAGVYFKEKKKDGGEWVVEVFDFSAIKPQVVESDS